MQGVIRYPFISCLCLVAQRKGMDIKMKNDEFRIIKQCKTIMTFCVVFYHSCLFWGGEWFKLVQPQQVHKNILIVAEVLGTIHVPMFVMCSGYLFFYMKRSYGRYMGNFRIELLHRAKRLLVPYIAVSLFWCIPFDIYLNRLKCKGIVWNYLLGNSPSQLWFLLMLFVVFCFFLLVGKNLRISIRSVLAVYFFSVIGSLVCIKLRFNCFQVQSAFRYMPIFLWGGVLQIKKNQWTQEFRKIVIVLGFSSLIVFIIYHVLGLNGSLVAKVLVHFLFPILSIIEITAIWCIAKMFQQYGFWDNNRIVRTIADNSFPIYLFHQQWIYIFTVLLNGRVHWVIQLLLTFLLSIICSLVMTVILKKNVWGKMAIGG